jgi:hypothetical protein
LCFSLLAGCGSAGYSPVLEASADCEERFVYNSTGSFKVTEHLQK